MGNSTRKFQRQHREPILSEEEYNMLHERIRKDVAEQVTLQCLTVTLAVVDKQYGKLKNRKTRLAVCVEEYQKELKRLLEPDAELRHEYEERMKQVGMEVEW